MRKPHIVAALQKEQARVLGALGGKALRVIGELLDDPDAPAGVRLDAAKATLDRIGLVAARTPAQSVAAVNDRPMNEWTTDELHAYLAALNVMKREQASEEPAALN